MAKFSDVNRQLTAVPAYQQALAGADLGFGLPTGADGRVLPGFRAENARMAAQRAGVTIPSGQIQADGRVTDPNADHWYSDPRVIGPAAVGAFTGGAALLGAPAAAGVGVAGGAGAAGAGAAGAGAGAAGMSSFWGPAAFKLAETGIGAGTNLIGNAMAARAANRAQQTQADSSAASLAFLKEQDARDYAEYLKERDRLWGHEDTDRMRAEEMRQLGLQREREREARLTPFRDGAANGYRQLSSLLTMPVEGVTYRPQRG